jgi:hypothetical protein
MQAKTWWQVQNPPTTITAIFQHDWILYIATQKINLTNQQ